MLGLDTAGKTTILYRMVLKETVNAISTNTYNVESFQYKDHEFKCWDIGGGCKFHLLWHHFYEKT